MITAVHICALTHAAEAYARAAVVFGSQHPDSAGRPIAKARYFAAQANYERVKTEVESLIKSKD